jgi:hypothetical protein
MGMAGAFGAIADDGYAPAWNPGGLAQLAKKEVATTFVKYFEDTSFGYIGYAMPLERIGVFGVGVTYLGVSDIEGRTADTEIADRSFEARDVCVAVTYAKKEPFADVTPGLDLGANLKFISQKIDTENAATAAVDLGALYHTPIDPLTIGMCVQNIGPGQKFKTVRDPLPLNVKLSGAYRMFANALTLAIEADQYIIDQKLYAGLGCEYRPFKMFAIRAGYRYGYHTESLGSTAGLAGGVSLKAFNCQLDYAFLPFGDLGDTHRVSFSVKF